MNRLLHSVFLFGALVGCTAYGDPAKPLPTRWVNAPGKSERLMVVLPGRGDNLAALSRSGIAEAVQAVRPDTDVVLVELTLPYYIARVATSRLHDEVVEPARPRYRQIWVTGASMGGLGAILYDAQYPGTIDGMLLLAPYLGEKDLISEIEAAGGLRMWHAGPLGGRADAGPRAAWQHVQTWLSPTPKPAIWLAYGDRDRLRYAMPALETLLDSSHVLRVQGGHAWSVWTPAARRILELEQGSPGTRAQ